MPLVDIQLIEGVFDNQEKQRMIQKVTEAMKVNVDASPQSSNAWDSLGDAYLADGQRDKAREAAEKALRLVDSDASVATDAQRAAIRDNAQQKLDRLKAEAAAKS